METPNEIKMEKLLNELRTSAEDPGKVLMDMIDTVLITGLQLSKTNNPDIFRAQQVIRDQVDIVIRVAFHNAEESVKKKVRDDLLAALRESTR